jgi:integrase/recombinase XerD
MIADYTISIFLDTRRVKESKLYPVKLRVFSSTIKKAKLYPTNFDLTIKDYTSIWETIKPRKEHQELRFKMDAVRQKANETAESIQPFTFEKFEKKLYLKSSESDNVFYQYELLINKLNKTGHIGNASNYNLSLKSIKAFIKHKNSKEPSRLSFIEITPDWLAEYEAYMVDEIERSSTTVSIYLRALRAVYNGAMSENESLKEVYPFGKGKYEFSSVKKVKKVLSKEDLKKLFECDPQTPEQEKAKDFWFFSYACNGANIKDIALLTTKQLDKETIKFFRAKTKNTSKKDSKEVTVYLNDYSKAILNKYAGLSNGTSEYIFATHTKVSVNDNDTVKHAKIKNFTKFINQNLKKLAEKNGISSDISTYWARHSFATNAIRSGASMEFVMEALSHGNLKTTQGYFSGFEDKDKKAFMQNIMNF